MVYMRLAPSSNGSITSSPDCIIESRPILEQYYLSLESRIGYWAFLGGTKHFGYWEKDTYWPFPITRALRAMEENLYQCLNVKSGAKVLDAGSGDGHVAMYMAQKGLHVEGIDIIDYHVQKSLRNIHMSGYDDRINIALGDYHHLERFADNTFDGVYTIETFVHATDPQKALSEFFRVLKPGGHLALFEYEHLDERLLPKKYVERGLYLNGLTSMPAFTMFNKGVLERMLLEEGFHELCFRDFTTNVRPLLRLFFVVAFFPYLIITVLGLEKYFVSTVSAVFGWRMDRRRYGTSAEIRKVLKSRLERESAALVLDDEVSVFDE
ncbi:MAG: hypothetical protein Q9164_005672 [Protoblastenia rupestris]